MRHKRGRAERAEAEAAVLREELTMWQAGGALARAVRALLFRRARS